MLRSCREQGVASPTVHSVRGQAAAVATSQRVPATETLRELRARPIAVSLPTEVCPGPPREKKQQRARREPRTDSAPAVWPPRPGRHCGCATDRDSRSYVHVRPARASSRGLLLHSSLAFERACRPEQGQVGLPQKLHVWPCNSSRLLDPARGARYILNYNLLIVKIKKIPGK